MAEEQDLRPAKRSRLASILADDINDQDDIEDKHKKLHAPAIAKAGLMAANFLRKMRGKRLTEASIKKLAKAVTQEALRSHATVVEELRNHALASFGNVVLEFAKADQDKIESMPVLTREDRDGRREEKNGASQKAKDKTSS